MTVNLSALAGAGQQFFDDNGVPLAGGKLYSYAAGTTTPQTTYTSASGATPHANPIVLNAAGRVSTGEIWLTAGSNYKFALYTSTNVLIATWDNITGVNGTGIAADATNVSYTAPYTGAVVRTVASKLSDIVSVMDFGAVGNGIANDTAALQAAISAIGTSSKTLLIPNPIKVNTNITFGANTEVWFLDGGKIVGTSGTELIQFQRQIVSGLNKIADNCDFRATTGMTVYPEWFGAIKDATTDDRAAFTKALGFLRNTGGLIQLQAGKYAVSDSISIDYDYITIQGAGNNVSWIWVTGTNKNGVIINGVSGTPRRNITLRDFSIASATVASSATIGLYIYYTAFAIIERMQIHDFLKGVGMEGAGNSQLTKVGATYTGGSTNGFIGFDIYGGTAATAANASSILRDCYASGTTGRTGQVGFKLTGTYMSDVQLDTCETALTNYGYYLDYSTAPDYNVDIIIRNPIVDRYFTQGILVNALPANGILQIIGGYTNPDTLGSAAQNIYLATCVGSISIVGHEFMALTNIIYTTGLYMTGCTGIHVTGCMFAMLDKGVRALNSGFGVISDNVFRGGNPSAFSKCVDMTGCSRMMINNNSFSGATLAVGIDATSSGCGIVGNTVNKTTVATSFTNSGSGPVGGADGSLGLNSGV